MNKTELIEKIAEETGLSKTDAKKAVEAFFNATRVSLRKGEKISLVGFGTFSVRNRRARKGRNPQTGKELIIAFKEIIIFKSSPKIFKFETESSDPEIQKPSTKISTKKRTNDTGPRRR
jgi:DNA-binding protein HU-beta